MNDDRAQKFSYCCRPYESGTIHVGITRYHHPRNCLQLSLINIYLHYGLSLRLDHHTFSPSSPILLTSTNRIASASSQRLARKHSKGSLQPGLWLFRRCERMPSLGHTSSDLPQPQRTGALAPDVASRLCPSMSVSYEAKLPRDHGAFTVHVVVIDASFRDHPR